MMRSVGVPTDGGRPIGAPPPQREDLLQTADDEWLHLEHFGPTVFLKYRGLHNSAR